MYLQGLGRPKDPSKALESFKKACELDDANSCNRVASMFLSTKPGSVPARNPVTAKTYLERACDANFAPACHNLAVMFKNGDTDVPQSDAKYQEYRDKTNQLIAQAGGVGSVKAS